MREIPVYKISVPEYHVRWKPKSRVIGTKIDRVIKRHFMGKRTAIRCLGSSEHRGKSISDLVRIIRAGGTDRYSERRTGDGYYNLEGKRIDFFALAFDVKPNSRIMEQFITPFYSAPKARRGRPVRINIATIYDRRKLKRVIHTYPDGRRKRDGYVFKDQANKKDSVLGIVVIR